MIRTLIAGVAGGVVMFVWTTIAHIFLPLGHTGISQIPNEAPVIAAMQSAMGDKPGLYFFPWVDPTDPNAPKDYMEKAKTSPSGFIIYHPPMTNAGGGLPIEPLAEFFKELIQTLIAAVLLSLTVLASYLSRVAFVTAIGVSAGIATNVSNLIWYRFPLDYTLSFVTIEIVGAFVAGLAIAAIIRTHASR